MEFVRLFLFTPVISRMVQRSDLKLRLAEIRRLATAPFKVHSPLFFPHKVGILLFIRGILRDVVTLRRLQFPRFRQTQRHHSFYDTSLLLERGSLSLPGGIKINTYLLQAASSKQRWTRRATSQRPSPLSPRRLSWWRSVYDTYTHIHWHTRARNLRRIK